MLTIRNIRVCVLAAGLFCLIACNSNDRKSTPDSEVKPFDKVQDSIGLLNSVAKSGDLILRLGDDFLSHQIRFMSHTDQSYSHVGVVVKKDNQTLICHIYPDTNGGDTVRYEPLDSFVNPALTRTCGLYRYNLTDGENQSFISNLDSFSRAKVHFDKRYELATSNVYCSEMIYKSLTKATNGRISPKISTPPDNMIKLLMRYFAKENPKKEDLQNWKFISLDDLYLAPDCRKILTINLQPNPNQ